MTLRTTAPLGPLKQLARLYGAQTSHYDVTHRRKQASPESLFRILQILGAPVETFQDIRAALRERRQALWTRCVEPVVVAWDGGPAALELRLPRNLATGSVTCELKSETGDVRSWAYEVAQLPTLRATEVEGAPYVVKRLALPGTLPWGYHRLTLEAQRRRFETMVIAAPLRAYTLPGDPRDRVWGVFLPLYALHSRQSWGGGDFSDLEALTEWATGLGGRVIATLPVLAAFLDEPCEPSPYAPASRLFWNEFYVDVTRVPELTRSPAARALLESTETQRELHALRSSPLVDYGRQMTLKRRILEELQRAFFADSGERYIAFRQFLEAHAAVEDYARFRATHERRRAAWPAWPRPLRDGVLTHGDYDDEAWRYHRYVQWCAHEQLTALQGTLGASGCRLYLDLPVGVHAHSYDVWRERGVFAMDASAGAPPDAVFTTGQNWGFPPLHPEGLRAQGYRYFIAYLRHQLAQAGLLRIDHVMGLHRLFWIPNGLEASEGVYVRYPAEELYAILTLESHRHRCPLVGENLGTVPSYVNSMMARHHVQRMYVVQYELAPGRRKALRATSPDSVASLNTHDMPPFAAFCRGLDIGDRVELGHLDERRRRIERKTRQALTQTLVGFLKRQGWLKSSSPNAQSLLKACLGFLGASPAALVLVNLEDLWAETRPQNIPGSRDERPNWQRKARYSIEGFCQLRPVLDTLRQLDRLRHERRIRRSPGNGRKQEPPPCCTRGGPGS